MSRYSDINQLLEEIGTSDRSAGDPWTISRRSPRTMKSSSFNPSVIADLGAPRQELTSGIQSAEQIAKADEMMTPVGSSGSSSSKSSTGSGLLGGLLNLFPLGSAIGKLFGLGGSSSPPPPTPYIQPPSINFQGAMASSLSGSTVRTLAGAPGTSSAAAQSGASEGFAPGVAGLSYGATGLPRTVESSHAGNPGNGFQDAPDEDMPQQLSSLTSANFRSEPAANSPMASADLAATTHVQTPASSSSDTSPSSNGVSQMSPGTGSSNSNSGQSILVQVQAMDSQSFMDHSNDIAQAVRQAMLNMHSVNDVIADL